MEMSQMKRDDDAGPRDDVPVPSELVEKISILLEEAGCPERIVDSVNRIIEFWESGECPVDYDTNGKAGFMLIGFSDRSREVVVNLGEDRTGHIHFTPEQARAHAALMISKAEACERFWDRIDSHR